MKKYYVDTCIWLNLFKKEGDATKGKPYWKIAEEFIKYIEKTRNDLIVSTIILKELEHKLGEGIIFAKEYFKQKGFITIIKTENSDYTLARELEKDFGYELGFYDCINIAISRRLDLHLITRDKELLDKAKKLIKANRPEDLIS